jgi:hypothetical protein
MLAAAAVALMLAGGVSAPAFATSPEVPEGQTPVDREAGRKPTEPEAPKKPECIKSETGFKNRNHQPTYEVALENSCDMRLHCTIKLFVMGAGGVAEGRGTVVLGPAAEGQATRGVYALKVKGLGGMASLSHECRKI